jgi:hypothetical protein
VRLKESGDWDKNDENRGYEELFDILEKFNKEGLMEEISRAYKLNELRG